MSDTMLFGVLKMPFEMAMSDEISRLQYYARVQELVRRFEAQQQAEPTCPDCKAAVLYECVACSSNNYPPKQQAKPVAWDKPSTSFNDWWNGDYDDAKNPFEKDSAAYWAWAGWQAAQRQWVGLTDEDCKRMSAGDKLVAMWADRTLKERNT